MSRNARRQVLFREVNERISEADRGFGEAEALRIEFMCECGNLDCAARIEMAQDEYDALRREGNRFVLVPGHEDASVESVVARTDRFLVVERVGEAREFAHRASLRTRS